MESNYRANEFEQLEGVEIVSQRSANEKVYDLGRGRRQAVVFAQPVHFRDEDGNWQDIDNTLEETSDANGRPVLRNRANAVRMEFDRRRGAVCIADKGHSLSWTLLGGSEVAADVTTGGELKRRYDERMHRTNVKETAEDKRANRADKLDARVEYRNARPGLSLRYSVSGSGVKEDIILDNAEATKDAALLLPNEYAYATDEQKRVLVSDKETGAVLFVFGTPRTYDANGKLITADVVLEECTDGVIMRYVVDAQFLAEAAYPVTIDPVVTTETTNIAVKDAYIWEANPSTNYGSDHLMRCGHGDGGESIALIRFENLTPLRASDTVISALLRMYPMNYGSTDEYIGCYPIKTAWTDTTVTWDSMTPENADHISDDMIAYITGTTGYRYFDITPLYREWYQKDDSGASLNKGVALRYPQGPDGSQYVEWVSAQYNNSQCPCMIVNYVSHAGRQSWWQYKSMGAGRAGTAFVDLFNGNLVYEHGDGATTGSRMPVGLTHIYNSCLSASNPVGCGMGWRTSMHQSVHKKLLGEINYYIWTDGGATEHYFPISGSQPYKDAEGMGLELATSGSDLTITSKGDTSLLFPLPSDETQQALTSITDALGNTVTLAYNSAGLLTGVTDGAGRTITLAYNSSSLLSTMTIPGRPTLTFSYTGSNLTGISYADVSSGGTTFTYESGSNLLTSAKNFDGLQTNIGFEAESSYDSAAIDNYAQQVRRVISLESVNGTTKGAKLLLQYLHMSTKVTSVQSTANDNTGKSILYQFNSAGNVTCAYDELGYTQSNVYSEAEANQLTSASKLQKVVINKVTNIDFSADWTATKASSSDSASRTTSYCCLNVPSVKITKAATGDTSYRHSVTITEAGMYTFSAYVKNTAEITSGGLFVRIRSGSTTYTSRTITGVTTAFGTNSAAEGWDRVYVSADLPVGDITVELVSTASAGTAYFACPQLEAGSIANHVNLLVNADFTDTYADGTRTFATGWSQESGIDSNALHGVVLHANAGMPTGLSGNAMRIHSYCDTGSNSHYHSIPVRGSKNDVFVVGGWVNANSVYSGDEHFKACLLTKFKNSSGTWSSAEYHEFDVQRVGWTFAQWAVVAPFAYTEMRIYVQYARNNGTAMFSNIFVHREQFGQSYTYDENDNVVSVASLSGQKSSIDHDDADNVTSYVQPGAASTAKYTMDYGSTEDEQKKHLLNSNTTPMGVKNSYTYDDAGNCLTAINQPSGSTAYIKGETTYTNKNYVATQKDARGKTVTFTVNTTDGTLTKAKDPGNHETSYTYDSSKRVTKVTANDGSNDHVNTYEYANDRITKVAHNTTSATQDVSYAFAYDTLGRPTTVKLGSQNLSTNSYKSDRSGLKSGVSFGNGGSVSYDYDDFNRLIGIHYDGESTARYAYEYGADGSASVVRDASMNRVLQTQHDLAGRPMGTHLRTATNRLVYRSELEYDTQNRLTGFGEQTASGSHKTTFTYDNDNRPTTIAYDGTARKVSYVYDGLGRIQSRTAVNGSSFASTYAYVGGGYGSGSTTGLVSSISQGDFTTAYTYDDCGHILTETRGGKTTTYTYDAMHQLVRVEDPNENAIWTYAYDRGGNITSKSKYNYVTGALIQTIPYAYNSVWKDKLASYNGTALTHDAIGNLTQDASWTYTWEAGRQLQKMTSRSNSASYLRYYYDHNGLRTEKTVSVDGLLSTTQYILNGKLIACLKQGSNTLHFFYDAQARPAMVDYNGVIYTYAQNYQGDILGLLDSTGAAVVTYSYDAWGRLLSTTGTLASTLGKLNPFRYRGYVYDEETGLYYLRSRYYNPEWGRFISSDAVLGKVGAVGTHNLFAYCLNNPASRYDQSGRMSVAIQAIEGVLQKPGVTQVLDDILDATTTALKAAVIWATGLLVNTLANAQTKPRTKEELKNALVSVESASYAGGRDLQYSTEGYYFAFLLRDLDSKNGFRNFGYLMYIDVPLSKEEALIVLASEEIISALMQNHKFFSNAYGIYTDYNWEAYDLSLATGGSLLPECHIDTNLNVGEYYWHYHAFNPVLQDTPHIWFGTPSFKLY